MGISSEAPVFFLLPNRNRAVADVLPAHSDYIAAPLRGEKKQRKGKPRARANRMLRLECLYFLLGPSGNAI
jgi:hypothetical protein